MVLAAVPGVVWGTVMGLAVGDAGASGIVEESLGGAGTALVLALFFIGVPAMVVGFLDGLTARITRTAVRLAVRVLLLAGLGLWAGLWIYAFADIDCDGTCIDPDRGIIWVTLAVTVTRRRHGDRPCPRGNGRAQLAHSAQCLCCCRCADGSAQIYKIAHYDNR